MTKPAKQKSKYVTSLDEIQRTAQASLKTLGFRRKGRCLNRNAENDIVHVISFQMGNYPVGEKYEIPGIRESMYGHFAVNLGVLLPHVFLATQGNKIPKTIQEYHCSIRDRLSFDGKEWLNLDTETVQIAKLVLNTIKDQGLNFLNMFQTYGDVFSYYNSNKKLPFQNKGRACLELGIIAHELGDTELSDSFFKEAASSNHKGFVEYVTTIASKRGYVVKKINTD